MARLSVRIEATAEGTEQRTQYENLPNGVYRLQVESATVNEKNENTSQHAVSVSTTMEVLEPEQYAGRKFFMNYNVQHPNAQAQDIGNRQFQCLLRALEYQELPDDETDHLLFKSFVATVGVGKDSKEKNSDGTAKYPARNEIKRYWYPDENNAPQVAVDAVQPRVAANDNRPAAVNDNRPAQAQPAAAGSRPWKR